MAGGYVDEAPSGRPPISGVPTAVTAFVGRAARGPVNLPVTVTSFAEFDRRFGGLWAQGRLGYSVRDYFLNGGGVAVVVRLYRADDAGDHATGARARARLVVDTLLLDAAEEGSWGNSLRARVDHAARAVEPALGETATSLFNLFLRDGTSGLIEEHRDVAVGPADHPRLLTRVLEEESQLARVSGAGEARPAATGGTADAGQTEWGDNAAPTCVTVLPAGEASDGQPLRAAEFVGAGTAETETGLFALQGIDVFNLLVIPPYDGEAVDTSVVTAAAGYCEKRRALLLVDPLPGWDGSPAAAAIGTGAADLAGALGASSKNAALYFPRLREPDPLMDDQMGTFAPSGAVAGVMARTDATHGVWHAPAGPDATLVGVSALSAALTEGDIGLLDRAGVNCLRALPDGGGIVWGAKTMHSPGGPDPEWKFVPVRRTALFIEDSLYRGTQWVVFEPNDEPLWARIRLAVGAFMHDLFESGAFQGTTPATAYFVHCDHTTTSQSDLDRGIVNVHVGFAPLRPAEFVVIRLQQFAGPAAT